MIAEHERTLLGEVLRNAQGTLPSVVGELTSEHFQAIQHQWIFHACQELFKKNDPVDIISVSEFLNQDGLLDHAGGRSYLNNLAVSGICTSPEWYAKRIREEHVKREIGGLSEAVVELIQDNTPEEALQALQNGINTLSETLNQKPEITTQELIQQALKGIDTEDRGLYRGPLTGFAGIDAKQKGLSPGEMIIVAGRPAMGKSAFALNVASHVAIRENRPVLFFSLEMEPVDLMIRILRSEAETGYHQEKLASIPIPDHYRILDTPALDVMKLKASILHHQAKYGDIGLVVVDYLQLMEGPGNSLVEITTAVSKGIKAVAREAKVPIMALSQLSRAVEQRQDKRPVMSDLRESGAIEQDADEIIFLYRHEYYHPGEKTNEAEAIIAKNRDGETGVCDLFFRPGFSKFGDKKPVYAG